MGLDGGMNNAWNLNDSDHRAAISSMISVAVDRRIEHCGGSNVYHHAANAQSHSTDQNVAIFNDSDAATSWRTRCQRWQFIPIDDDISDAEKVDGTESIGNKSCEIKQPSIKSQTTTKTRKRSRWNHQELSITSSMRCGRLRYVQDIAEINPPLPKVKLSMYPQCSSRKQQQMCHYNGEFLHASDVNERDDRDSLSLSIPEAILFPQL